MSDPEAETEFIGSHLKAKNGYGQNGFQGASSDTPGEHTTSGFLPAVTLPAAGSDGQTRSVSKEPYPTTFGMKARGEPVKVLSHNTRRPNEPRTGRHFQR